jgi:hypothetical protein
MQQSAAHADTAPPGAPTAAAVAAAAAAADAPEGEEEGSLLANRALAMAASSASELGLGPGATAEEVLDTLERLASEATAVRARTAEEVTLRRQLALARWTTAAQRLISTLQRHRDKVTELLLPGVSASAANSMEAMQA